MVGNCHVPRASARAGGGPFHWLRGRSFEGASSLAKPSLGSLGQTGGNWCHAVVLAQAHCIPISSRLKERNALRGLGTSTVG